MRVTGLFVIVACFQWATGLLGDPYRILNVARSASPNEIRQAYKELVKEWHPDKKKDDSSAQGRFIEIKQAYELLMDPQRRREFDRHGWTEDTPNFRRRRAEYLHRYDFDSFEPMFGAERPLLAIYHNMTVTTKSYENRVLPDSHSRLWLLMFYSDHCSPCLQAAPLWHRIQQELEPIGIEFGAVHAEHEEEIRRKLSITALPYIVAVIAGRAVPFGEEHLSLTNVINFVRKTFELKIIERLEEKNQVPTFLSAWRTDDKVRAIFFSQTKQIKLRYMLAAFKFRDYVHFGFVCIENKQAESIRRKYNVLPKKETLLLFNEYSSSPFATVSMPELSTQTLHDAINANKFLILPRVSSQPVFNQLCPNEASQKINRRRLCVIWVTVPHTNSLSEERRTQLRLYIKGLSPQWKERVSFMYMQKDKQNEFIEGLRGGNGVPTEPSEHFVIIWRRNDQLVEYQWISKPWTGDATQMNASKEELSNVLARLLHTTEGLACGKARLRTVTDENAQSLVTRILKRLALMADALKDNVTKYQVLPVISVVASFVIIVFIGYCMSYLVQLEEMKIRRQGKGVPGANKPRTECKLSIHELRGETYNGLVRLLKPGCRTIVLLVDTESKPKLLPQFFKAVFPYRKNKTLMFAFMMLEKNLEWYRRLLLQTLGESSHRPLNINPKNCIGTVLSLNGHRKYFCVYHAKHREEEPRRDRERDRERRGASALPQHLHHPPGSFLGFESSDSEVESDVESGRLIKAGAGRSRGGSSSVGGATSSSTDLYGSILFEEHLLDGLSSWLDKLFDGTTRRYYIQYWPECMK
ncbi:dnaJ homolog subfamily C member 16 [Galendromus occidentalis]|uniref:DnaJ homolog subfamily C member 16 n=1 Tax=Galendromus occidentalis TaxID=34638 RepID=A0AAJ7WJA0_9ACAR|nr:dnaJ homolog subfamily C member 16 [Galendromus occidentalis]